MAPGRVDILGVGFDRVDLAAAAERIIERHAAGQQTFVITANPEFVMLARADTELAAIARSADLVVADGTGVLVASRVLRDPLPGRVPGRLLVPAVLRLISGPVFLLGAAPGVAEQAAATLVRHVPSLSVEAHSPAARHRARTALEPHDAISPRRDRLSVRAGRSTTSNAFC